MDVPLSQTGLRQAELLGYHLQYQQYSHVYVSDLSRAMQVNINFVKIWDFFLHFVLMFFT